MPMTMTWQQRRRRQTKKKTLIVCAITEMMCERFVQPAAHSTHHHKHRYALAYVVDSCVDDAVPVR